MTSLIQTIQNEEELIEEQKQAFLSGDFRKFKELSFITGIDYATPDEEEEIGPGKVYEDNSRANIFLSKPLPENHFSKLNSGYPSKNMLLSLFDNKNISLRNIYTSLITLPFEKYYPFFNLDELLLSAKEIGYLKHKNKGHNDSFGLWDKDVYSIFHELFLKEFSFFNGVHNLSDFHKGKYKLMNPYSRKSFKDRLGCVSSEIHQELKEGLKKENPELITEASYLRNPSAHQNSGDVILEGAPCYRKQDSRQKTLKKWSNYYAGNISKIIKDYELLRG